MDLLDRLLAHDHWATARLLDVSRGLTDSQLDQPFDIGHRSLRATFDHMILNVEFWTGLMVEQPIEDKRDASSVTTLIEDHERSYATFATVARQFRDEQRLEDTYIDHFAARKTFGGTIIHVVLHNAEHRSEALHILERLGVPDLPEVDHGLWDYETQGN
ncbi:MAG: DinB family protein [Chloroflexota bacterium]|nr:DinB family protein [Chloroflexota bacterium]